MSLIFINNHSLFLNFRRLPGFNLNTTNKKKYFINSKSQVDPHFFKLKYQIYKGHLWEQNIPQINIIKKCPSFMTFSLNFIWTLSEPNPHPERYPVFHSLAEAWN